MSEEKKYRNYTAEDIVKYHGGLLSLKEMNELEKAALDDPFLADALEGYGATPVNAGADISELEKKLQERITGAKVVSMVVPRSSFKWWKVAAAVLIIGGIGFFTYQLSTNNSNNKVAKLEEKKSNNQPAVTVPDSNKLKPLVTSGVTDSSKGSIATTFATSKRNSSTGLSNTTTNTTNKEVASPEVSVPIPSRQENGDTPANQKQATSNAYAFDKTLAKKSESNNKELVEVAPMQQKVAGVRVQQEVNYFRGRVVDANSNPLPFANITNTRDKVGTYADAKGNFTLISPDSTLNVQVRSVGFENNLAQLKNNVANNQVILREDKVLSDKIISYKKTDTSRYRKSNVKFEEPEPADGWSSYGVYLANNTTVPDDLKKKDFNKGDEQVSFEVNQNGDPINFKIEKSLCQKCDEEAIRLIKEGPKWKKKNKKTKRVTITVPFDADR